MADQDTPDPDELRDLAANLRCAASCREHHDAADQLEAAADEVERLRDLMRTIRDNAHEQFAYRVAEGALSEPDFEAAGGDDE